MKKLLLVLVTGCLLATGCAELLRDELADVHNQIEDIRDELELLKEQMNTNIGALRVLVEGLQSEDFIKSVVPITEGSKVIGYTITFTKSQPITIYHGQDGKDGEDGKDGKDGTTPVIGVKQDNDGAWYWTIDGAWLLDGNGNKVRAEAKDGANGKDGTDGTDGTDGKDGKTPKLKIEDGYWYISVDDGVSWEKLGQATGNPGAPGDSMFSSIDVSDPNKVVFTLQDGTVIVFPTWESFSALQQQVFILNTNLSGLEGIVNALQSQDYITSVVPLVENMLIIGYTINFKNSEPVTIYYGKDGKDGSTPVIGVKQDEDGVWYWTIDGEWMTDSAGKKVRASAKDGADGTNGVTPQLKIEEGYWYLSLDKGETWEKMGQATGDPGEAGDSMIKSIDTSDETFVVLTLADGTILTIPRNCSSQLVFTLPDEAAPIQAGETRSIPFTISGSAPDKAMVTVASDGTYVASVNRTSTTGGTISVTAPNPYSDGHVIVMIYDGNGYSSMQVINFCRRRFSLSDGAVFQVNGDGGTVTIPWTGNYLFSVSSAADWIHPIRTRTDYSGEIVLSVDPNPTFWPRTGIIRIHPEDNPGYTAIELVIEESTASVLPFEPKTMVLTVRPSYANDFTVYLPFRGNVHCSVDWGDGTVDSYVNNLGNEWIHHTYDVTEPTDFKVSITGTASQMDAHGIPQKSGIISVDHWGNMGIEQVHHAFYQITSLQSVCADTDEFFARVTSCEGIFEECVNLRSVPDGLFQSGAAIQSFDYAFKNCTSLSSVASGLFQVCSEATSFSSLFECCNSLQTLPKELFAHCPKVLSFRLAFRASGITELPEELFASCPEVQSFESAFELCLNLRSLPAGLFDNNRKVIYFEHAFGWCYSLTGESPYTIINGVKVHLYERKDWPDYFVTPVFYINCFADVYNIEDRSAILSAGW